MRFNCSCNVLFLSYGTYMDLFYDLCFAKQFIILKNLSEMVRSFERIIFGYLMVRTVILI